MISISTSFSIMSDLMVRLVFNSKLNKTRGMEIWTRELLNILGNTLQLYVIVHVTNSVKIENSETTITKSCGFNIKDYRKVREKREK